MGIRVGIAQPAREGDILLDVDIARRRCDYRREESIVLVNMYNRIRAQVL